MIQIQNIKIVLSDDNSSVEFDCRKEPIRPMLPIELENEESSDVLSVAQFASKAGITPQAVRKMISERRLKAKKIGEQYVVPHSELNRYLQVE